MIQLGAIVLDSYLQVPDWPTAPRAAGSERMTLGQRLVVQRLAGSSPVQITLTARLDGSRLLGQFKKHQVDSIRALADSGEVVTFTYHSQTVDVVVALGGINVEMIGDRTDPDTDHPYVGTITLLRS